MSVLRNLAATLFAGLALAPVSLAAQPFPNRTITVVVPFPAGGTTDLLARIFAQKMSEALGQSVVVENVGGGGGSIGADKVAKAEPDGYTLMFHNITFSTTTTALQVAGRAKHGLEDFAPVSLGANVPLLLVAKKSMPANNLKEFVAFAKQTTEPLFYGSTGPGSIMNLAGEVLKRDAAIKMDHVPFRGAAPLIQEVIAERIHFGGDQMSSSLQHARSGALKSMAVMGVARAPELPDVPTVREMGYPNIELRGWNGFFAPARTPESVVTRLHQEIAAAVKHPDVQRRFAEVGAEPVGSTPTELYDVVRDQMDKVRPMVAELKLVVQ